MSLRGIVERAALVILGVAGAGMLLYTAALPMGEQQFSHLARAFLRGRADLVEVGERRWDLVFFEGKYFWPLGPAAALFLVPGEWWAGRAGVWLGQGYVQAALVAGVAVTVYVTGRKSGWGKRDSWWWVAAWCGSTFLGVALVPWSWQLAQVTAVLGVWWAIAEYFGERRYWRIGTMMGLALAARLTAGLGVGFFVWKILAGKGDKRNQLAGLLLPITLVAGVLGWYNWARFGNVFEQGYGFQILQQSELVEAREWGLFSWKHLPMNLYYMLLSPPLPVLRDGWSHVLKSPFIAANPWGMGLLFTGPYLLWLAAIRPDWGKIWPVIATVGMVAVPILFYYGGGARQLGYRYALDFLPWLQLLLMEQWRGRRAGGLFKAVVAGTAVTNLYFLGGLYGA